MAGGKVPPFREDFFERIIDVQWEVEPKVYWMVATGTPMIINGMAMGYNHASMWTSDDGKSWQGPTDLHVDGSKGFGAVYTGCWMRANFKEGGQPVWVIGGGTDHGTMWSCMGYSTDGKTVSHRQMFDGWHVCHKMSQDGEEGVSVQSQFNGGPQLHNDVYKSSDGQSWEPLQAHPDQYDPNDEFDGGGMQGMGGGGGGGGEGGGNGGGLLRAAPANVPANMSVGPDFPGSENSIVYAATTIDPPAQLLVPSRSLLVPGPVSLGVPSLREGEEETQEMADKIVFIGPSTTASGKVKVGKHRGKVLEIKISPYTSKAPAHGGPGVTLKNKKTGKSVGKANTGVERSINIGYGHYVFVVGGSNGPNAVVSYSENGMDWKLVELGPQAQINPIVVGPQK